MQRPVGRRPALSVGAAAAILGETLLGEEGPQLLAGVLESLPMAVAIRRVGPGCPVEVANERFQLWLDSLSAPGNADGASVADEVSSMVTATVRSGRPQHLRGLRPSAPGEGESEPPDVAAVWDISVHPLRDGRGRVAHVVQTVRDATGHAAADDLSAEGEDVSSLHLRIDRMMALDKLKSDFMNLTTHELRSPLAIVYGYLSMMESGMLGELSAELREAVGSSIKSVELMMQLVTELVEMARLDETRLDPTREPVDLAGVVAEVAVRVESSDHHHLRMDLGASPVPVLGDRGQLLRVFANLVDNAIKYSPDGGEIGIRMRRLGRQVAVDISDQGVGIAPSDMDRLFTRFGRIVTTATEGIGGTGLGLYLCRELVRRLGGDVTATSKEGQGSVFTVRLPAVPGSARTRLAS